MKRLYSLLLVMLYCIGTASAQVTPQYSKVGTVSPISSGIFLNSTSGRKIQLWYNPTDFGILPSSGSISTIYFKNTTANASGTYTNFIVSFSQPASGNGFPGTTFETGLTQALNVASITLTGSATAQGWFAINLATPFAYDNSLPLVVEVQYASGSGMDTWASTSSPNKKLYANTTTATTGSTHINYWQDFGMDITLTTPCNSSGLVAGQAITNNSVVCASTPASLNITGNTYGIGQTYEWFSSPTQNGTYTTLGLGANSASNQTITPTATAWYKAQVACGATTAFSDPVKVDVTPALPAFTYKIDASQPTSGTSFHSFAEAINALSCGIAGPVVFEVEPGTGPYTEQIIIPQITGTSANNTITINGRGETIQFNTSVSASRYVIRLDGADHIILDSLTIKGTNATYGWGMHILGQADSNMIKNCTIDMTAATSTTAANTGGIVVSNSNTSATTAGNNANRLQILNNEIIGAYRGIIAYGSTGATNGKNHVISNNTIRDFYADGIVLVNTDSALVINNDIHRANRVAVGAFAGIDIGGSAQRTTVMNNRIHDTHNAATTQSGTGYGLVSTTNDVAAGLENRFINNLLYNFNSTTGTVYGIYNNSSDGAYYYHNTISLDHPGSTSGITRGFYVNSTSAAPATNIRFQNNIVTISRGGTGIKYNIYFAPGASVISNNNDLVMNSTGGTTNAIGYFATGFTSFQDWQGANSQAWDQQSRNLDPQFANAATGNFTPTNILLNDAGADVGVSTDFYGWGRGPSFDIGAIEFPNNPLSAKLLQLAAARRSSDVLVTWSTATEKNMNYYVVERSNDGRNFTNAGNVTATGNTELQQDYSLNDMRAAADAKGNMLYYRLRMVEVDGNYDYSKVITVAISSSTGDIISVYPNPFTTQVVVKTDLQQAGQATIILRDVTGKQLLLQRADMAVGANNVSLQGLDNVPAGVYELSVTVNGNRYVQKLVK